MTIEALLEAQVALLTEVRDLLKGGAAASTAPAKETTTRTRKAKETKAPEPAAEDDEDLTGNSNASAPGDDLDDDLGGDDDDGLGTDEPQITAEEVRAALMDVKAKVGKEKALEIMKKVGKSDSVAGIKDAQFAAVIEATQKALKAAK